ncbi:MAG TPA: hypothetical protein VIA06_08545 [Candidatus Dormibacteraeota bacterium]|nr:hypothetical protein [Candidatus Dormibacteraeota bacterium]
MSARKRTPSSASARADDIRRRVPCMSTRTPSRLVRGVRPRSRADTSRTVAAISAARAGTRRGAGTPAARATSPTTVAMSCRRPATRYRRPLTPILEQEAGYFASQAAHFRALAEGKDFQAKPPAPVPARRPGGGHPPLRGTGGMGGADAAGAGGRGPVRRLDGSAREVPGQQRHGG